MRVHKRLALAMCIAALVMGIGKMARAEAPVACESGTKRMMYDYGFKSGQDILSRAWSRMDSCDELNDFREIVRGTFGSIGSHGGGSLVACRLGGMFDGFLAEMNVIEESCGRPCVLQDGQTMGELASRVYCSLAGTGIPLENLSLGAVDVCGRLGQKKCANRFDVAAWRSCGDKISRNPPTVYRDQFCNP